MTVLLCGLHSCGVRDSCWSLSLHCPHPPSSLEQFDPNCFCFTLRTWNFTSPCTITCTCMDLKTQRRWVNGRQNQPCLFVVLLLSYCLSEPLRNVLWLEGADSSSGSWMSLGGKGVHKSGCVHLREHHFKLHRVPTRSQFSSCPIIWSSHLSSICRRWRGRRPRDQRSARTHLCVCIFHTSVCRAAIDTSKETSSIFSLHHP